MSGSTCFNMLQHQFRRDDPTSRTFHEQILLVSEPMEAGVLGKWTNGPLHFEWTRAFIFSLWTFQLKAGMRHTQILERWSQDLSIVPRHLDHIDHIDHIQGTLDFFPRCKAHRCLKQLDFSLALQDQPLCKTRSSFSSFFQASGVQSL
eukprot:s1435_g9.t1